MYRWLQFKSKYKICFEKVRHIKFNAKCIVAIHTKLLETYTWFISTYLLTHCASDLKWSKLLDLKVHVLLIQNLCSLMFKVLLHFSCSLAGWDWARAAAYTRPAAHCPLLISNIYTSPPITRDILPTQPQLSRYVRGALRTAVMPRPVIWKWNRRGVIISTFLTLRHSHSALGM